MPRCSGSRATRAEQPRQPPALAEVHVDQRLRHEPEAGPGADRCRRHVGSGAAEDHRAAHRGGACAGAADDQAVAAAAGRGSSLVREPTRVRSLDWSPPLKKTPVAVASSSAASSLSASARPRSRSSLVWSTPSLRNTRSYSASDLFRHVGGGGHQHDPGLLAAAELDEPLQQAGAAAAVLGAADDEQPTWRSPVVHVLRPRPGPRAVHDAVLPPAT